MPAEVAESFDRGGTSEEPFGGPPRDVVNRLYLETARALRTPEVREKMARLGAEPMDYNPEQFNAYIRDEIAANAALVKAAGIKAE